MKRLLIIGYVWPEPNSSAAGTRMMQLIGFFLDKGMKVCFASPAQQTGNEIDLAGIGVRTENIILNSSDFDEFVKVYSPDMVLFDRFMMEEQFGWRVARHCPNAIRILDTEDLHFLRKTRHKVVKTGKPIDFHEEELTYREAASIYRCDLTLVISEAEMEVLTNQLNIPSELLFYLPLLMNESDENDIKSWTGYEDRKDFMFIGNFLHEPNWDAVRWLKNDIWPTIRERLPEAELHIYGAYPSQKVFDLHNDKNGFIVKGKAENVNEVMKTYKVCLAPLRFGAGLKGKLLDAMANGTPSITTPVGAEGINGNLEWGGYIAVTVKDITGHAVELYTNRSRWLNFQRNGMNIINNRFQKTPHLKRFDAVLSALEINILEHRKWNFTGKMLQHHTMQSYKYLSKWIEEKNKSIS